MITVSLLNEYCEVGDEWMVFELHRNERVVELGGSNAKEVTELVER